MKIKRISFVLFISLLIVLLTIQIALAATDGVFGAVGLDPSFDTDGIVTTSIQGSDPTDFDYDAYGKGVAFQPDGKILVVGTYWDGNQGTPPDYLDIHGYFDLFLARYCQNGLLDDGVNCGSPAFGTGGITTMRVSAEFYQSIDTAVMVLSDGKILVGGDAVPGTNNDFFLARFTSNGVADNAFGGGDGLIYYNVLGGDVFRGFTQLPSGKILMAGYSSSGTYYLTLLQFDQDGNLDTSFNTDGISTLQISGTSTTLNCFAAQPDGKIVIGGYLSPGIVLVARLTSNGDLDTTFSAGDGSDGYYLNDLSVNNDGVTAIAIQPDGKILAAAYSYIAVSPDPVNSNIVLFRFNSDGSLDTDFDGDSGSGNGIVTTQVGTDTHELPSEIQLQSDGKFLVGGYVGNESVNLQDLTILRYTSAGLLDTTFNTTGIIITNITNNDFWGMGRLTPDGKLVVAGMSGYVDGVAYYYDVTVLRYMTGVTETGATAQIDTGAFTPIGNSNIWAQFNTGHTCASGVITATKTLDYPGGTGTTGELPLYWDLSTNCAGEYSLNIKYCYTDGELALGSGAAESNLELYKFSSGAWVDQNGTVDTALNCVEKDGITSLSSWTLTDPTEMGGPTAVQVQALVARTPVTISPLLYITAGVLVMALACLVTLVIWRQRRKATCRLNR